MKKEAAKMMKKVNEVAERSENLESQVTFLLSYGWWGHAWEQRWSHGRQEEWTLVTLWHIADIWVIELYRQLSQKRGVKILRARWCIRHFVRFPNTLDSGTFMVVGEPDTTTINEEKEPWDPPRGLVTHCCVTFSLLSVWWDGRRWSLQISKKWPEIK